MGQIQQKDSRRQVKGAIFVQLTKTIYSSVEEIQGELSINLEEPFKGHILQVTLLGVEETHFTYQTGRKKKIYIHNAYGINNFLNFSIPIYDFSQGSNNPNFVLQPCQIQIPFQINLAQSLPSSMKYFLNENNQCSLKYSVIASIIPTEDDVRPISGSQEVFIGQKIENDLAECTTSIQQPEFCCSKQGEINYIVTIRERSAAQGDNIKINLDIDFTKYDKKFENLIIKLYGQLVTKATDTQRQRWTKFYESEMSVKVDQRKFQKDIQFKLPNDLTLTCQGQLIQVFYVLEFFPDISQFCCSSESHPHEMRLYILPNLDTNFKSSNAPVQLKIQPPQNWNPQYLQPTLFSQDQISQIKEIMNRFMEKEEEIQGYKSPQNELQEFSDQQYVNMEDINLTNQQKQQIQQEEQKQQQQYQQIIHPSQPMMVNQNLYEQTTFL